MEQRNNGVLVILSTIGISAFFLFFVFLSGYRGVDAGEVAVVTRFGAVTGKVLQPGANFVAPFVEGTRYINTKFLIYETMKTEDEKKSRSDYKDGAVDTNTKDGQPVNLFYTIRFSIDPTKVVWVVEKFGGEEALVDKIIRATSRSVARVVPSNFTAEELYLGSGKEEVGKLIFGGMQDKFAENGVMLDSVLIREISFTKAYTDAIEAKQIAAVQIETEKNISEQAKYKKLAKITAAEASAKEQELQRQTISQELLQLKITEKWDGHYPQYLIIGGAGQFILPLPNK